MVVSALIASVGLFVHNIADLPGQTILSLESSIPILTTAVLVVAWFTRARRAVTWVLLGWGMLHLVGGGILSVLPLPFLPFVPEQSVTHYLSHLLYVATQLPLVITTIYWLRAHRRQRAAARTDARL